MLERAAGVLGGLAAAATAVLAPESNAPILKFAASKQVQTKSSCWQAPRQISLSCICCTVNLLVKVS